MKSGYEVCGIARTVKEAVVLDARHNPDLAVLDLRLADQGLGTEIAAQINRPGRPGILYATGNATQIKLTRADGEACLSKPYRPADLVRALTIVEQLVSTGEASPPFPAGFQILEETISNVTILNSDASRSGDKLAGLRRQQAALAKFGTYALGESAFGKVLAEAARVCAEGLDMTFCAICKFRREEDDLLMEAGVGWDHGVIGRAASRADESSPQGRAFITGQPVVCGDLNEDATFLLPSFYAQHGIVSTMNVIIKKAGRIFGVLEIGSTVQHDYDRHDIDFLTGFANVLADGLSGSNRNLALQGTVDRLQDMIAEKDRAISAQTALLEEKSVLLQAKNRLLADKTVFAQELQHRVRNNLQLVHGMLSKQLQATTDETVRHSLNAIARRVATLAKVYEHLLGTGLGRMIDVGGYLSSLCSGFQSLENARYPDVGLTCHWESVILDLDSATVLGLVVSELISNSYDHAFPNGTGMISVSLLRSQPGKEASIIFTDDGAGFCETGDSRRHGLGLVRRLMQQVNGSAALRSDNGTEWTLKFPVSVVPSVAELIG